MKDGKKTVICLIILICSLILINVGIMSEEVQTVENKSTNICLECIGIG